MKFKISDLKKEGYACFHSHSGDAILATLVYVLLMGVLSTTVIGSIILGGAITFGFALIFKALYQKKEAKLDLLFGGFDNFGNNLAAYLLQNIYIILWSLLFFIPGIIKSYAYSMTFFILTDNPTMDGNDAITKSKEIMKGNKWNLFVLDLSFIGWLLLCGLTFGILSLWVIPKMQMCHYVFYRKLVPAPAQEVQEAPAEVVEA
jgi:uncharacterized membrane protein